MAETPERLLAEYRERFLAGERPDALDYLGRAGTRADRLAGMIDDFLIHAPPLDPHPDDLAAVRAIAAGEPTLAAQRSARGIRRKAVIDAIIAAFGLKGRRRVEERYHELESGLIDPRRADPRLIDVIAGALGIARSALLIGRPPEVDTAAAFLRPAPPPLAAPVRSLRVTARSDAHLAHSAAPAPKRTDDAAAIDRLFGVEG